VSNCLGLLPVELILAAAAAELLVVVPLVVADSYTLHVGSPLPVQEEQAVLD